MLVAWIADEMVEVRQIPESNIVVVRLRMKERCFQQRLEPFGDFLLQRCFYRCDNVRRTFFGSLEELMGELVRIKFLFRQLIQSFSLLESKRDNDIIPVNFVERR